MVLHAVGVVFFFTIFGLVNDSYVIDSEVIIIYVMWFCLFRCSVYCGDSVKFL